MDWTTLSAQGYWVFPTTNRRKFPTKFRQREWSEYIATGEHEMMHAFLMQEEGTGAALCPLSTDPVPLLILDLDCYGTSFDSMWEKLVPGEEAPKDMGVVETPSGGFHLWFQLPGDVNATRLPASIDFGNGVAGEIRVSAKANRLIMLPGSLVTNKQQKPGKYKLVQGDIEKPGSLCFPPDTLVSRLVARPNQGKAKQSKKGKPTEAMHFVELLDFLAPEIPEGDRNNFVARVGQVLGRLHPGAQLDQELLPPLWDALHPRLGKSFKEKEFRTALASGWATGSKNGEKYQAREKHPTVTDIKAECEGVFGGVPWMAEVFDSTGKLKETLLGFGGSAKRRHEASKVAALRDIRNLLATLASLSSASLDTVARSPLFIQPGWVKALDLMLQAEKGVDTLGVPIEERFWTTLEEWAREAAGDMMFLQAWTEKRPGGMALPFVVWPKGADQLASLVLTPHLQEVLLTQMGDLTKANRLAKQFLQRKTLVGMKRGNKVWTCPISLLPDEAQEYIGAQYEVFVRRQAKKASEQAEDKDNDLV